MSRAIGILALWLPTIWSPPLLKQDFKRSAAYLSVHQSPEDVVVFLPSWERSYFDYYRPAPYRSLPLPSVDQDGLESATDLVTPVLTSPDARLWLVSVEPEYGDRQLQLQDWLDRHARLVEDVPFANLDLREYRGLTP